jgi:hypothetical protein
LNACASRYIEESLPQITALDPVRIVLEVLDRDKWLSSEDRTSVRKQSGSITRERVAEKFRENVSSRVAAHYPRLNIDFQRTLRPVEHYVNRVGGNHLAPRPARSSRPKMNVSITSELNRGRTTE